MKRNRHEKNGIDKQKQQSAGRSRAGAASSARSGKSDARSGKGSERNVVGRDSSNARDGAKGTRNGRGSERDTATRVGSGVRGSKGSESHATARISSSPRGNSKVSSKGKVRESRPNDRREQQRKKEVAVHEKIQTMNAEIIGLTHDGEGVGRTSDGYTLFLPNALPGEKVVANVLKSKKQYGFGEVTDFKQLSDQRVEPPCPIYDECGGCQLQHFDYEAQLVWKRQHVIDSLSRIGKLDVVEGDATEGVIVHPTVGMSDPWRYRNKAAVPIGRGESSEELVGGFYAKGSHRIIEMEDCLIQKELNDEVIREVKAIAKELRVIPYDEATATGVLRHVMTRIGVVTGEVMVVLITNTARLPRKPEWIEHIRKRIPNVKSIVHNVNDKVTNAIFGDTTEVIWGKEVIYDKLDGITFAISARSFYQVNPEQTIALYQKAVEYAGLTGKEQVIDAYCGIGTISLFLARNAGHVYGVEIVPEAIEDAKRNAKLNELENTTFEAGPAEVVIPRWKKEGMNADVIVVDPPRKGCDPALLETILAIKPERVVYVSCNPSTLARDLRLLEDGGYKTVEVTPVDMFPHTGHVECVVWLERV